MTIFSEFGLSGSRGPLGNAQGLALEQLVCIQCVTSDLRWAMVELAWRSLSAMFAFAQGRLVSWVRRARPPRPEQGHGRHCCC
jgi:hypothetical protein